MNVNFRDRTLKAGEKYHHYCSECGAEIHPDMIQSHRCKNNNFKFPTKYILQG